MSEQKETAVQWLIKNFHTKNAFEKAEAMEREQIVFVYSNGWHDGQDAIIKTISHIDLGGEKLGKEYYNNVFVGNTKTNTKK